MARKKRRVKSNVGAKKAMQAIKKAYGANWRAVYYGRAAKFGPKGLRPQQKANAIYGKGSHVIKRVAKKR